MDAAAQIGKLLRTAIVIGTITFVGEQFLVEIVVLSLEAVAGPFDWLSCSAGRILHGVNLGPAASLKLVHTGGH